MEVRRKYYIKLTYCLKQRQGEVSGQRPWEQGSLSKVGGPGKWLSSISDSRRQSWEFFLGLWVTENNQQGLARIIHVRHFDSPLKNRIIRLTGKRVIMILCTGSSAGLAQEPLPYNFFKWAPTEATGVNSEIDGRQLFTHSKTHFKDVHHSIVCNTENWKWPKCHQLKIH